MAEELLEDHDALVVWGRSVLPDIHEQRTAILYRHLIPYAVLVNPATVPHGVIGGTILGLPVMAGDVEKPTVTVEERTRRDGASQ